LVLAVEVRVAREGQGGTKLERSRFTQDPSGWVAAASKHGKQANPNEKQERQPGGTSLAFAAGRLWHRSVGACRRANSETLFGCSTLYKGRHRGEPAVALVWDKPNLDLLRLQGLLCF
jgi:hypothetical protein